jgi:V-type H+-transporting ATPase subunit C
MGERKHTLEREFAAKKAEVLEWSQTAYSEVFSSWMHLVAVRLFVESILRYGLPPSFVPVRNARVP